MKYLSILLISLIAAAKPLLAKTTDALAVDYAEGAAYFLIAHQAMEQSGEKDAEISKSYGDMYTALSAVSMMLSWETRSAEMGEKVTLSRIANFKRAMGVEMGNRNENIAILINKYGQSSFELFNNAAKVIEQLEPVKR